MTVNVLDPNVGEEKYCRFVYHRRPCGLEGVERYGGEVGLAIGVAN